MTLDPVDVLLTTPTPSGGPAQAPASGVDRERIIEALVRRSSTRVGPAFLEQLATDLGIVLGVRMLFVGEVVDGGGALRTLALNVDGELAPGLRFCLEGTPCETVLQGEALFVPSGLAGRYPGDDRLGEGELESYFGLPLRDEEGRAVGVLSALHDAPLDDADWMRTLFQLFAARVGAEVGRIRSEAERLALQKELAETRQLHALGTLAGGIAHDFNNLLSSILGNLQLARYEVSGETAEMVGDALSAAEQGRDLVRQILTFARGQVLEPQDVDLAQVVEGALRSLHGVAPPGVLLQSQVDPEGAHVRGDPHQLGQVLANLGTNAVQAMGDEGTLTIRVGPATPEDVARAPALSRGCYRVMEVEDTGPGIPPEVLEGVFEPFFTTRKQSGGSGLGLSIVDRIVRAHGGTVHVDSVVGRGTSFRVLLPQLGPR